MNVSSMEEKALQLTPFQAQYDNRPIIIIVGAVV